MPYLVESAKAGRNPHILVLAPPPDLREHWFAPHVAYTMAKYAMSMCVIGLAGELRDVGVAVNGVWPLTGIATSALSNVLATPEADGNLRTSEIMADAAYVILNQDTAYTGHFCVDEFVLRSQKITDFSKYKVDPKCPDEQLLPDFFLPEKPGDFVWPPKQVLGLASKL
ncbi:hypothetical protein HK104_009991 [Borealophlyctis nickersoniae]|nr:hypothetical protein HK104_009991 [Borealophlyctis nickersoniae]